MKAFCNTVLILLACLPCKAADTTIAKLMHTIIKHHVDSSYHYFYLIDKAVNPRNMEEVLGGLKYENPKINFPIPVNELLSVTKTDTSTFYWSDYNFEKARCIDWGHLPKYIGQSLVLMIMPSNTSQQKIDSLKKKDVIVILVKPNAGKRAVERQKRKVLAAMENRPGEEKNYYAFSKPIFSKDKQYVFISVSESGQGGSYVLKNNNGRWEVIYGLRWVA